VAKKWGQKNPAGEQQKLTKATEAADGVAMGEIDKIMEDKTIGRGILTADDADFRGWAGGIKTGETRKTQSSGAATKGKNPKSEIRNPKQIPSS
jgi:hypothetical protein